MAHTKPRLLERVKRHFRNLRAWRSWLRQRPFCSHSEHCSKLVIVHGAQVMKPGAETGERPDSPRPVIWQGQLRCAKSERPVFSPRCGTANNALAANLRCERAQQENQIRRLGSLRTLRIASTLAMLWPTSTSTCRNFRTISAGLYRLIGVPGPPFPRHTDGPIQIRRLRRKAVVRSGCD